MQTASSAVGIVAWEVSTCGVSIRRLVEVNDVRKYFGGVFA
jgi:hypothetical protein